MDKIPSDILANTYELLTNPAADHAWDLFLGLDDGRWLQVRGALGEEGISGLKITMHEDGAAKDAAQSPDDQAVEFESEFSPELCETVERALLDETGLYVNLRGLVKFCTPRWSY